MQYRLFADRFFFLHFAMNFLILYMTARLGNYRAGPKRLFCGAAAGSLFFMALFLIPAQIAVKAALFVAASLGMLQLTFRFWEKRGLLRAAFLYITAACLLGGTLALAGGMKGILLPAAAMTATGSLLLEQEKKRRQNPYFKVVLKEGARQISVTALADSGNSLYDPISGQPVCVADREILEELGLLLKAEKLRVIPYHSVGKKHGLLQAAAVDEMYLEKAGQKLCCKKVLLAASTQKLSSKGRCRLLLHPALLEEKKGENHDIESSDAGKDAV